MRRAPNADAAPTLIEALHERIPLFSVDVIRPPAPAPADVDVVAVAGGFDAVVQCSGAQSLRMLHHNSDPRPIYAEATPEDVQSILRLEEGSLSPALVDFLRDPVANRTLWIEVLFLPEAFEYRPGNQAQVTYRLRVTLSEAEFSRLPAPGMLPEPAPASARALLDRVPLGEGTLTFTLECHLTTGAWAQRVMVSKGNLNDIRVQFPEGVVSSVVERYLADRVAPGRIDAPFWRATAALTPWMTLGGPPGGDFMPEFAGLTAQLKTVGVGRYSAAAVCFAFPETTADISDVEYFLCGLDYGSVTGERALSAFCAYRWRHGAFYRTFHLRGSARIAIDGLLQDVVIEGMLQVNSLDRVRLATDSVSRHDVLMLAGRASIFPTAIWAEGRSVPFSTLRDRLDLGTTETSWAAPLHVTSGPVPQTDLEGRRFQDSASRVLSWFARPFVAPDDARVQYSRIEGILKKTFFLGTLSSEAQKVSVL